MSSIIANPTTRKTIGIIGAAVAGLTLALHILSHPLFSKLFKPTLYDQALNLLDVSKASTMAGAAVALGANGLFPLFEPGLRQAVEEQSCDIAGARFRLSVYGEMEEEGDVRDVKAGR
jgi:2-polyprenyl-6-methoxyphenol hydroxylase-like FAD-dependent oxidoreductase